MSFLEVQDLATVAAQTDLELLLSWCTDCDALVTLLEVCAAGVLAVIVRRRAKR